MPQQEEGDKGHNVRQSGGGQHNEKRGTKGMIQGNQAMAVVGGGDVVGGKRNIQIEATTVVVGTVCTAIDSGEAMVKGEMIGWRMMQGNWVVEDTMGGGGT
jgi:hypothetical protein